MTGRARVVIERSQARGLTRGEILVGRSTDPSWTPLFLTAGGTVMEEGGPLSHAAIVARELRLPAVLNAKGATRRIRTGMLLLGFLARVADHDLLTWDVPVREAVLGPDAAWFASVMRGAGELGSRWLIAALTVPMVALAWARCRQLAVVLAAAFPAALALELFLKAVVDRPRPMVAAGFGSSFPSGHVLAAAAVWGLVPPWTYLVTRRRWAWAASAGLAGLAMVVVGASRIYVGAHWPSDVVGGYLGGAVFLLAAEWAVRRPSRALACQACDLHPLRGGGSSDRSSSRAAANRDGGLGEGSPVA